MKRALGALAVTAALALGGCAAGLAASAAGMALSSAQREPASNAHLKPQAIAQCTARAATLGTVHIIDVEQRSAGRMIVWGTVSDSAQRRSFECHFTTAIAAFRVRPIRAPG